MENINNQETVDLSKLKCLYIDDQLDSQILFKVLFKEMKSIKFSKSFEEAITFLNKEKFDYILIDINLPGRNGIEAMRIIKNNSLNALVPIIAVTAYLLPGDKEKYFQAGFDDFVAKPIFRENVISAMNRLSQKKELVVQEKFCSYPQLFKTVLDQVKDLRRRMEITIHPVMISLPEPTESNEIIIPPVVPQSLSDLSCLYLDFYQDAYIFFSKQLKDLKSIKFAQTSEEAASLLNTEKFDFIIIDINFNNEFIDMVSIDVLNKASRLANIPIIGVSASSAWDEDDKDLQEKFDAYIEKPLFKDKVVSVLNKFFFQKE